MNKPIPSLFFSYSHKDKELIDKVREILLEDGYSILSDHEVKVGQDFLMAIFDQIKQADYYLLFLSPEYLSSKSASSELNRILGYLQGNLAKVALPVLLREADLPPDISKYLYLKCIGDSAETISIKITEAIDKIEGQKVAKKEEEAKRIESINISIADYIEPVLTDLKEREKKLMSSARIWNVIGFVSIILGVIASIALVTVDLESISEADLISILYLAVKGAVLLILLLTSSKYAFTLSKSYMNESLKNADRIHAISFGKFYIKVFENSIAPNDFKEIFQNWNLSKESSFSSITTENYDPKISDSLHKILETAKDMIKGKDAI